MMCYIQITILRWERILLVNDKKELKSWELSIWWTAFVKLLDSPKRVSDEIRQNYRSEQVRILP